MKISLNCFSCSIGVQVESVDQKRGGESRVTNLVTQRQQLPVRLIRAESTFSIIHNHFQIIFLRIRHFGGVPNMQVCVTSTEL